ncbi:MAG: DciA family protein [Woeseiaceae bacterium]
MSEKSLEKLLNSNADGGLGKVIQHARDMGDLVQMLQKALPAEQAPAIAAANIRDDGELVILATSSAWASRLRYETEVLINAARTSGKTVNRCTVRVNRE